MNAAAQGMQRQGHVSPTIKDTLRACKPSPLSVGGGGIQAAVHNQTWNLVSEHFVLASPKGASGRCEIEADKERLESLPEKKQPSLIMARAGDFVRRMR